MPPRVDFTPNQVVGEQGKYALTVIAAHDKLSPIRATIDQDVRRPYWVELGEAVQFNWNERIILEGDVPAVQLALEGFIYEPAGEGTGKVELTDSLASSFLRPILRQGGP